MSLHPAGAALQRPEPTPSAGPGVGLAPGALVPVRRDGNPLRSHGHASPVAGKLAPLDGDALARMSAAMAALVPRCVEPPWLLGVTESSLVHACFLAPFLPAATHLGFTTREPPAGADARSFEEPHSHAPHHFVKVPRGADSRHLVVVEDELSTGRTLRNLLFALRDACRGATVLVCADGRSPGQRAWFEQEMARAGLEVTVHDLATVDVGAGGAARATPLPAGDLAPGLRSLWRRTRPRTVLAVGECVQVPLALWSETPRECRPVVRHVTRSPWLVDGAGIVSRLRLGGVGGVPPHFLYNAARPETGEPAWIVSRPSTARVAGELAAWWRAQGGRPQVIEVPSG